MLFVDLDGVLVEYIADDYLARPFPFEKVSSHYFEKLPPIANMWEALLMLQLIGTPFAFLSTIGTDNINNLPEPVFTSYNAALKMSHYRDKLNWLVHHGFDINNHPLICADHTTAPKPQVAINHLKKDRLSKNDILIDDFKDNLNLWMVNGGTGIKCFNNLNTKPKDSELYLDINDSPEDLASQLYMLATIPPNHPLLKGDH